MFYFRSFLFIFSAFITSCFNVKNNPSPSDNIFRYNEKSAITSLDPAFSNTQSNIWVTNQLFNTLTELDSDLLVQPSLSKQWVISDDGLEYTFIIRDDVYFHHSPCFGSDSTRKLVASDFVYSVSRLSDSNILSPGAWVMDYIENTYSINDTTLIINLKKPFPGLLGLLSMNYFSILPKEAISFFGSEFSKNPIGTGPFQFTYWQQNEKLVLKKNDSYFEYDGVNRLPYLDGVSISFITQNESAFMNFILGNFDFLSGLDNSFKDEFLSPSGELLSSYEDRFFLITTPYLNTEYLGINIDKAVNDSTPLMFKAFRKALNYSFDRAIMAKYLRNGLVVPAHQGFVPSILLKDHNINGYFYSPDSVYKYLKQSNYKNEKIILHTTQEYLDICEFLQYSASKFGINIVIEISAPAIHRNIFSSGKSSFFRASWIADYPDPENFLALFYSKNKSPFGPNYTHFSNEKYDSLYELSFIELNQRNRYKLFSKMELILIDEAPFIPLYYDFVFRLVSKNISGMSINCMNELCLKKIQKTLP